MNKQFFAFAALAIAMVGITGCANQPKSNIGLVDVPRITSNWAKFQNYQNQLNADVATIQQSRASQNEKQRQLAQLQSRFQSGQNELTGDMTDAARQVAGDRHLTFVFTKQYVGYGGVDITTDVEKILKIEEKATPKP